MIKIEFLIIVLNAAIAFVAYLSVYPKLAGSNINKIAYCDLFATGLALFIVGSSYWGSEQRFNLILVDVNWFWFTLLSYFIIEIPFIVWYFKKHKVTLNPSDEPQDKSD